MNVYRAEIYAPEIEEAEHIGIAVNLVKAKEMCEAELEEGEFLYWIRISSDLVHGYFDEGLNEEGSPKDFFNYFIILKEKVK